MRAGYHGNLELQKLAERADSPCRVFVEAVVTVAEDLIDTPSEWNDSDGSPSIFLLADGGLRLAGADTSFATLATDTSPNAEDIDLQPGPASQTVTMAAVEWGGAASEEQQIHTLTARLDPDYSGGGQEVAYWLCQAFRVVRVSADPNSGESIWDLLRITDTVRVTAGGSVADVEFPLSSAQWVPTVGPAPRIEGGNDEIAAPTTVFLIWAVDAAGAPAANARWLTDDTTPEVTSNGNRLTAYSMAAISTPTQSSRDSQWGTIVQGGGVPRMTVGGQLYSEETVEFTTNPIDLGVVPTGDVELVAEGQEPNGSALTFEVWDGSAWTEFADGDRVGVDNTATGGFDLTGVGLAQTYDMRVTLTPSPNARVTPYARRMGARALASELLDDVAIVRGASWSVDPRTMRAAVPTMDIEIIKDGIRDYRDAATELLSDNFPGDLLFRLWYGHPTLLARRYWLHIDDFVPEDQDSSGESLKLQCLSPLGKLKRKIPYLDTTLGLRQPAEYAGATIAAAYDDVLRGQIGLPGRYIGPGPADTTTVTKTITEEVDGKVQAEQLAFLAGGCVVSSQGRLKFRDFETPSPPVESFGRDEITILQATPGYSFRVTDFVVRYGWNEERNDGRGGWSGDSYGQATAAIEKLDRSVIEQDHLLDDDTSRWIENDGTYDSPSSALADRVSQRQVQWFGFGMILLRASASEYPRPWLEAGDPVVIPTDDIVLKDPLTDQAIRGPVLALGRIIQQLDPEGSSFLVWVKSAADIFPDATSILRTGYANPRVTSVSVTFNSSGQPVVSCAGNKDAGAFRAVGVVGGPYASAGTVDGGTLGAADATNHTADITLSSPAVAEGETVWVAVRAYEKANGSGEKSIAMLRVQATRPQADALKVSSVTIEHVAKAYGAPPQADNGDFDTYVSAVVGDAVQSVTYTHTREVQFGSGDVVTVVTTDTPGTPVSIGAVDFAENNGSIVAQGFSGAGGTGIAGTAKTVRYFTPGAGPNGGGVIRGTGGDGSIISKPSLGVLDAGFDLVGSGSEIGVTVSASQPLPATSGTVTLDRATGAMFRGTAGGNIVLAVTGMSDGQVIVAHIDMGGFNLSLSGIDGPAGSPWTGKCIVWIGKDNGARPFASLLSSLVSY